ncbi:MAG: sporulation protein YabP [Clostridiales bacterium]|nr:sporulation protein YabP [Clostridiales bacterium]
MEEKRQPNQKIHSIMIENREKMIITSIEDVESFDEESIIIYTSMGILEIKGSNFRINRLNVEDGEVVIEGVIDSINYSDKNFKEKKIGFFSRIFK